MEKERKLRKTNKGITIKLNSFLDLAIQMLSLLSLVLINQVDCQP